ncbi:hypothetical protein IWQ61_001890 [Dispira simplex]|nr:hypothetical protein IWQ61_001890 [Dispira simplex]
MSLASLVEASTQLQQDSVTTTTDLTDASIALEILANVAHHSIAVRTQIADHVSVTLLASLLAETLDHATRVGVTALQHQTLRLLANLVADHTQNRQVLLQSVELVVEALVKIIGNPHAPPVNVRCALGTVLNTSAGYDPWRQAFLKRHIVDTLLTVLSHPVLIQADPKCLYMLAANFTNLAEVKDAGDYFATPQATSRILDLLLTHYQASFVDPPGASTFSMFLTALHLLSQYVPVQKEIVTNHKVPILARVLEFFILGVPLDQQGLMILDNGILQKTLTAMSLLENQSAEPREEQGDEEEVEDESWDESRAGAINQLSEILISITSEDQLMGNLFDSNALDLFRQWLNAQPSDLMAAIRRVPGAPAPSDEHSLGQRLDQLQGYAALCIGNLSRSDAHCIKLVKIPGLMDSLVRVIQHTKNYQTQHALTGLLRNLAIPAPNKRILGQTNLIPVVARLLDTKLGPLQVNVIAILKSLLTGDQLANALRMVQPLDASTMPSLVHSVKLAASTVTGATLGDSHFDNTPLGLLIQMLQEKQLERVHCEGSRIIVNLVKIDFASGPDTEIRRVVLAHLDRIVSPLAFLVTKTKFDVLVNEGLLALNLFITYVSPVLLAKALSDCQQSALADEDEKIPVDSSASSRGNDPQHMSTVWFTPLASIVSTPSQWPLELRANALRFLLQLAEVLRTHPDKAPLLRTSLKALDFTKLVATDSTATAPNPTNTELVNQFESSVPKFQGVIDQL